MGSRIPGRVSALMVLTCLLLVTAACGPSSPVSEPSSSAGTETDSARSPLGDPNQLGEADVRRLFDEWEDYATEPFPEDALASDPDPYAELVLRNVDFATYCADEARDLLIYAPDPPERKLTDDEKDAVVEEALGVYRQRLESEGATAAYEAVIYAWDIVEHDPDASHEDNLLFSISPDFALLDFMTAPSVHRSDWTWEIVDVTIEGTDTAHIVYTARKTDDATEWSFKDESVRYEKVWRFVFDDASGRWLLSEWPNRMEFIESVDSNIDDPLDTLLRDAGQPFWWLM